MAIRSTMRHREFTAKTVDQAVERGLHELGLSPDEVHVTVVKQGRSGLGSLSAKAVVKIAYDEELRHRKQEEAEIEQYLTLRYAPDGYTLKIDRVPEMLQPRLLEVARQFLVKHGAPGFCESTLERLVKEQSGIRCVIFEPEVVELDGARTSLYLSPSELEAYCIQYDTGRVQRDSLLGAIRDKDIAKGILDDTVESIIAGTCPRGLPVLIAQGQPPRHDPAPGFEYQFEVGEVCPCLDKANAVSLDDIIRLGVVQEDGLLLRRNARTPGQNGWTISGRELAFETEPDEPMPSGPNTYVSDDGQELRASIEGRVELHDGLVSVTSMLAVQGDAGRQKRYIEFDGSIVVGGDALPGVIIKATGNVDVLGSVNDALIEAGGDVVVQFGIAAQGRGRITARGDVKALHFDNVTVDARRIFVGASAVNSHLTAVDFVEAWGDPGAVVGGVTKATNYVLANFIGSELGTHTEIVVGDTSEFDEKITEASRVIDRKKNERERLMAEYERAATTKVGMSMLTRDDEVELKKMLQDAEAIDKELPDLEAKLAEIKAGRQQLSSASCHVANQLYEDTAVSLFTAKHMFEAVVSRSTLLYHQNKVRVFPFQYRGPEEEAEAAGAVSSGERSAQAAAAPKAGAESTPIESGNPGP
jgi:uncharacterized protein (DUF342 family)